MSREAIQAWLMKHDKIWAITTLAPIRYEPEKIGAAICEKYGIDISHLSEEKAVLDHILRELENRNG